MTAVATFPTVPRAGWPNGNQNNLNQMSPEEVARLFIPRKGSTRNGSGQNPEAMWNINGGGGSTKKKTNRGGPWPPKGEVMRVPGAGSHSASSSVSAAINLVHQPTPILPSQHHIASNSQQNGGQGLPPSYLILLPLNDSFDPKFIPLPYYPETLRIGRQTNNKTVPSPTNGFFDSKVLSRQHAEVWAEKPSGRVWIRDVRSSNGTFVNGTRLSQENRESDPHEIRAEDVLELGIDIVAEDNKTIIHHKVMARVEHAGFQVGAGNEMNFGEVDPMMGNGLVSPQNSVPGQNSFRGRSASQGSRTSNVGGAISHRQLPMLMQSISVEQIVKRLNSELHMAKKQSQELQRTSEFFDSLLTLEVVKREPEIKHAEQGSNSPMIDSGVAMESPQFEHAYSAGSERSKHIVIIPEETRNGIPSSPTQTKSRSEKSPKSDKPEPPQHLFSLVSQLRDARLELEAKSAKMRELEELLRKERTAREMAEDRAAQLELASLSLRKQERQLKENLNRTRASEDSIDLDDDQADDISIAGSEDTVLGLDLDFNEKRNLVRDEATVAAAEAAAQLQKKVEEMMAELEQAKEEIESYRQRVRTAEEDGEKSRKSLAEMVATLRADEERRRKSAKSHGIQTDSAPRPVLAHFGVQTIVDIEPVTPATVIETGGEGAINANGSIMKLANGSHKKLSVMELPGNTKLMKQAHSRSMSSQSAPYVSIVSVVIIGVGIMAVLNSWQKGER